MRNVLILLISIFFLFIAFNSVSSFFTLFAMEHLHVEESTATGKFAFLAALMLLFALPAGFIGEKLGKKKTIFIGIVIMILDFGGILFTTDIDVIGFLFIPAGAAWALIMINIYPYVVSMADSKNIGSYTGLYYLFSSLAAIASPPLIGFLIDLYGYGVLFRYSVASFILALVFMLFVRTPREPAGIGKTPE
jgi:MFS family permease